MAVTVAIMVKLGDYFPTIAAAREAIQQYVFYTGESYKTESSNKKCYIICCNNGVCSKQYCKGDHQRRHKKCGTCGEEGHNKGTCRNQPVANGQR
jgi:hypothetical protein